MGGKGGAPGNTTSDIVFYLGEEDVKKELQNEFDFKHSWGSDIVFDVSAKKVTTSSGNEFDISMWVGINYDRFEYMFPFDQEDSMVWIEVTPFLNGKAVRTDYSGYGYMRYSERNGKNFSRITVKLSTSASTIDEIEIEMTLSNSKVKSGTNNFVFYKKKFKVNPK
jgi:hypothetical protein